MPVFLASLAIQPLLCLYTNGCSLWIVPRWSSDRANIELGSWHQLVDFTHSFLSATGTVYIM